MLAIKHHTRVEPVEGIEPPFFRLQGGRSSQRELHRHNNYLVPQAGNDPATSCFSGKRSTV